MATTDRPMTDDEAQARLEALRRRANDVNTVVRTVEVEAGDLLAAIIAAAWDAGYRAGRGELPANKA